MYICMYVHTCVSLDRLNPNLVFIRRLHMLTIQYHIVGKSGEELILAVWQI